MSSSAFWRSVVFLALLVFAFQAQAFFQLRILKHNELREQQNWLEALKVIREELADPYLKNDTYRTQIHAIAIDALGNVAKYHGWEESMDVEAKRIHEDGLKIAGKDELLQAQLNRIFALYYSKTGRNGLAAKMLRQDLEYWKKVGNTYQIIAGYDGLASAYGDMGELQLEEHYRRQAMDVAKVYFKIGVNPPDNDTKWLEYEKMLFKQANTAARPGNREELEQLWATIQPIADRYLKPKSFTYQRAAEYFAVGREPQRAAELFEQARRMWAEERSGFAPEMQQRADLDFQSAEGTLLAYAGKWAEAAKVFEAVFELRVKLNMLVDDMAMHRLRGWAHEGAADYDKAIEAYRAAIATAERTRQSYSVAERASFFRSIARRPYWGLIRTLVKRGRPGDYLDALRAMELVRARQLGELLDPATTASLSNESLEALRQSLKPSETLLAYTLSETELVVVGMTRDRLFARTTAYDERAFSHQAVSLARRLAQPDSPLADIQDGLGRLSRILLDPVAAEFAGKTEWLVLPDGAMNAVPFELLTRQAGDYRPLIADTTVRNAPSLRFIAITARQRQAQTGSGLFAVADPAYPKNIEVAGLTASELQTVTRSNVAGNFAPLPETRSEVASIARLLGSEPAVTLLGEQATESEVKRADLSRFRFVHLATHGILGGDVPGIGEPALVLAEETGEDGFLTASEAEKLKLQADLTVLSACNTGTGEFYVGEGVMGMGRAFLAAGSRAVLVSLWPVESKATEALMVSFYRNLKAGQGAAEALRRAKLEMLTPPAPAPVVATAGKTKSGAKKPPVEVKTLAPQPPLRSHPFFWAPFVLFGG